MKRLVWFGLGFLSVSWLFFIPIFTRPDLLFGFIFIILGCICNIVAFYNIKKVSLDKKYLIFYIPVILVLLILPFPYNIGPIIILIAGLIYNVSFYILDYYKITRISFGLSFTGLILLFQTAMIPFFYILSSHYHRIDFLSYPISLLAKIFGLSTSVNDGIIFVQTVSQNYPFTVTLEKIAFFPWFMMFVGALLIFLFSPKLKTFIKNISLFLFFSFIWILLRYVFLTFVYIYSPIHDLQIYYDTIYIFISLVPLLILFTFFIKFKDTKISLRGLTKFGINKKRLSAMILIFIFVFSIVGSFSFYDPGERKQGKILIDELHSDWEDTSRKMDKEWYGKISTYSAYCFAEWFDYHYEVDKNLNKTITSDLLKDYDILIIKCPTNSFSENEVDAIVKFVEDGGGLYLIGDHTNVFGMNFYLNQVSERFGIIFKYDSTHDLETKRLSIYESPKLFNHPIMQYTEKINFLSSCTVDAPLNSEEVIIGYGLSSAMGTYSTENFFRKSSYTEPDIEQGLFLQTIALKYGRGRIVAFTDSTCISNFCLYMDGYPSFYLMTIEYLNRSNMYSYVNSFLILIAIISIGLFLYVVRKEKKSVILLMLVSIGLLSFSFSTPLFSYINYENYKLPEAHSDFKSVCFVEDYSDFVISSRVASMDVDYEKVYNTFFIWTQRVDYIPSVEESLSTSIDKGDVIVFINPVKTFEDQDIKIITNYLEKGGNVVFMDTISNNISTANGLLNKFDLSINKVKVNNSNVEELEITGNNSTFFVDSNYSEIAINNIGKGKLVVIVDSQIFSNRIMGGAFTVPNTYQREIYDIEFYLFEEILS